jgi:hypothetical protein
MADIKQITSANLIESLRLVVPKFEIDPLWLEDNLGYLIINDLGRYICEQAKLGDFDEVRSGLAFLEMSMESGDSYMHDLVHESLETLTSCHDIGSIRSYFGPRVRDLWSAAFDDVT